jgi:tRNA threonylcarbamoyladenosine biosynthesis protein TsaE
MNQIIKKILSEEEMLACGAALANAIEHGAIVFLYGPLGTGKTTFTRGFLRGLGYHAKVKSPTYTLVEPYDVNGTTIYHFDLYRLTDSEELEHIGIREYFKSDAICLIEWPDKGFPLLPVPDLACYIAFAEEGREMRIEAQSIRGQEILKKL